jgi:diguanylate cyclase (GGDEF)-like protein
MQRLLDALLTTDPAQRVRLAQAGLATLLMTAGVLVMAYFAQNGIAAPAAVAWWGAVSIGGLVLAFALIRSGCTLGWSDPALAVPQIVFSIASGAWAYAIAGSGRGGVFPILMIVLMFGMFGASPARMRWVSLYAVVLFGVVMALQAWRLPGVYAPAVELGHFLVVAIVMPAAGLLTVRLSNLRERVRSQRSELRDALGRIQELATRDELTGLVNRRHMQLLLEQERQRSVRAGHPYSVALLDIDRFKRVNDEHGHAAGDVVLKAFAREALGCLRMSDVLARWGGEEFVVMMPDTRHAFARIGAERLRERIAAATVRVGDVTIRVTVSIGLTEHRAGETVSDTLARADGALYDAKTQGRDRVVVV